MVFKNLAFEIIIYLFHRVIHIRMNFVKNNFFFFFNFFFRKLRIKNNIRYKFCSPVKMVIEKRSMYTGFLFGGISIQLSTYYFQPVQNLECFSFPGAFKKYVLNKMCNALFPF